MKLNEVKAHFEAERAAQQCDKILVSTTFGEGGSKVGIRKTDYGNYKAFNQSLLVVAIPRSHYQSSIQDYDISEAKLAVIPPNQHFEQKDFDNGDTKYNINITSYLIEELPRGSSYTEVFEDVDIQLEPEKRVEATDDGNRPFDKLTKREYACILLRVPRSGQPWLDELIRQRI